MALSPGGLAGIILFLILLHIGVFIAYYIALRKNSDLSTKLTLPSHLHDVVRWVLLGLLSISWIFSVAATASCSFLTIKAFGTEVDVGLNSYAHPIDGCVNYDDISTYRNNTAFTFAVFNCLLTTSGVILMFLLQFLPSSMRDISSWLILLFVMEMYLPMLCSLFTFYIQLSRDISWLILRIVMYISMWCCLFTFYIQEQGECDAYDCSLAGAGVTQVFNVIFLIIISILLFLVPHAEETVGNANNRNNTMVPVSDEAGDYPNANATITGNYMKDVNLDDDDDEEEEEEEVNTNVNTTTNDKNSNDDDDDGFVQVEDASSFSSDEEPPSPNRPQEF